MPTNNNVFVGYRQITSVYAAFLRGSAKPCTEANDLLQMTIHKDAYAMAVQLPGRKILVQYSFQTRSADFLLFFSKQAWLDLFDKNLAPDISHVFGGI